MKQNNKKRLNAKQKAQFFIGIYFTTRHRARLFA